MTCIPLGKIPVPTPGTPVQITLTAAQAAMLPDSGVATKVEVWPDPTDTGVSFVKDLGSDTKIAVLPVPANGHAEHWQGEFVNPLKLSVDNSVANDGPFVIIWVA